MESFEPTPMLKLTDKKVMPILLESLKSLHKQQENKKKNYKKLIGFFSIRVHQYDDNTRIEDPQSEVLQLKKKEMINIYNHKKKKGLFTANNNNNSNYKDHMTEHSYNSDSSIYTKEPYFPPPETKEQERATHYSITKFHQNEKMKWLKHKFNKQIDQKNSKRFLMENDSSMYYFDTSNLASNKSPPIDNDDNDDNNGTGTGNGKKSALDIFVMKNLEKNKELICYDDDKYSQDYIDNNNKCFYSLDQKSRIIYIKPSPKSNSVMNSKIISKKATKNISNVDSAKCNQTPRCNNNEENEEVNLNHDIIVEKLNDIKMMRIHNGVEKKNSSISSDDDDIE